MISVNYQILIAAVVFVSLAALLRFYIVEKWHRHRRLKAMRRGEKLEKEAARFLRSKGFYVLKSQPEISYCIWEDGAEKQINITPDYLVEKNGQRYLVEVKSGKQAPGVSYAPTRRQLLEYVVASQTKGIYLLDMENKQLKQINFDLSAYDTNSVFIWVCLAVSLPIVALFFVNVWWKFGLFSLCGVLLMVIRQQLKHNR